MSTLIVLGAACLLLTTALGAAAAIRRGAFVGPELDLRLGDVRVMAVTSEYADCNPRLENCQASVTQPQSQQPRFYAVWVVTQRPAGSDGTSGQVSSVRLMALQAPPAPK